MYIDYEKIGEKLGFGKKLFYNLKVKQNLNYISKNQEKVLKKLKNKPCLNVVFYVYDETKWKLWSVYNLMKQDDRFNPKIVVTKNCAPEGNANYQTRTDVKRCYDYFKNKGADTELGYDIERGDFIPFETFTPDIIVYSHPWYVYKTQGPVMCSKFALTYYIPYFIPASEQWHEYGLRFHQYLFRHYVPTEIVKEFYSKNMTNKGKTLRVVGHPVFDELINNNKEKKYIIYAPHWTVCGNNLRFGSFDWSGNRILEFAKAHTELNWVFRPHPLLYKFVLTSGFMQEKEICDYYNDWKTLGILSTDGDYADLFSKSYAMITDCGSFLTEYLVTGNPVIHLISEKFSPNPLTEQIDEVYYGAHNIGELNECLEKVILNKNDDKQNLRIELLQKLNLNNICSGERIIEDILSDIGELSGK